MSGVDEFIRASELLQGWLFRFPPDDVLGENCPSLTAAEEAADFSAELIQHAQFVERVVWEWQDRIIVADGNASNVAIIGESTAATGHVLAAMIASNWREDAIIWSRDHDGVCGAAAFDVEQMDMPGVRAIECRIARERALVVYLFGADGGERWQPAKLAERLDIHGDTLRKYVREAGLPVGQQGIRGLTYSRDEVVQVCETIKSKATNLTLRKSATALLQSLV